MSAGGVAASNKGRKRERRKRERMERDDRGGGWGIVGNSRRSNYIGFQVASRKGFTVVLSSTFSVLLGKVKEITNLLHNYVD